MSLMTVSEVAAKLGLSVQRVKQLDSKLSPQRTPSGWRIYQSDVVERVRKERLAAKKKAASARSS